MQFWIDLEGIALSEADKGVTWMQAFPMKKYSHPLYGELDFSDTTRLQRFAENIKNNVVGTDLDIDYDHKKRRDDAAGWIKDAEVRLQETDTKKNGLWIAVEWTKEASQKIKEKAYRYFSPEFVSSWTHPQSNMTFNDVMRGGGLTNRPFLKDILPINLSEILTETEPKKEGTVSKLREKLGLPESATEDEVEAAVDALKDKGVALDKEGEVKDKPTSTTPVDANGNPTQLSELAALAETSPAVAKLLSEQATLMKAVETLTASNRLSEVVVKLSEINSGKTVLTPAITEKLRDLAVEAPKELSDKFLGIVKEISDSGVVSLSEIGATSATATTGKNATEILHEKVVALSEAEKIDYATALNKVTLLDESMAEAYITEHQNAHREGGK